MDFFKKLEYVAFLGLLIIVVVAGAIYYNASKTQVPASTPEANEAYDPMQQQEEPASAASSPQANPFNL